MFKVSARTVLELGSELISSDIIAFYELIKNSFDAGTKNGVNINFNITLSKNEYSRLKEVIIKKNINLIDSIELIKEKLNAGSKNYQNYVSEIEGSKDLKELLIKMAKCQSELNTIEIFDTGNGMSMKDLREKFLVIGTPSRKKGVMDALNENKDTPFLGEKGIGRLSMMRLANQVSIKTAQVSDNNFNRLDIDWTQFENIDLMIDEIDIKPIKGKVKDIPVWSGCEITLSNLVDNWHENKVSELVKYGFSKIIDPFLDLRKKPKMVVSFNGERIPVLSLDKKLLKYCHAKVIGEYRISDGEASLKVNSTIINAGVEHPIEESSYTLTQPDLIGSIVGKNAIEVSALASLGDFKFEIYWFNRRLLRSVEGLGNLREIRDLQKQWSGMMLFRDQFRVYPYGEDEDDWLSLDRKALSHRGYSLNKTQFIGKIDITRLKNPFLIDQTNREGLRETDEKVAFIKILQFIIQGKLLLDLRDIEKQYKKQKVNIEKIENTNLNDLEKRARNAVKKLEKITPAEGAEIIGELNQTVLEFSEFATNAKRKIAEYESDSLMVSELAGVGLMSEIIAHELARTSENALLTLSKINKIDNISDMKKGLLALRDEMRTLSKRVAMLDPIVSTKRQRFENTSLSGIVKDVIDLHNTKFQRHNIVCHVHSEKKNVNAKVVRGMLVQILSNLISNSKYWMMVKKQTNPISYQPEINIFIEDNPPTIIYTDNGTGISVENKDNVFRPFFSLKEISKRRGLGLYISKENAEYMKGSLVLDSEVNQETNRLHTFILELTNTEEN
ncbi:sensor histidine kinase [Xenorhabdus szentirmaii]|uniref:sensor histidine kinase n=1 Tax=Xenorhabdus szentirmaii TaxID=290112 RepID=UPI000C053799|nr:sensor histidine kinase [Xenorhabdus szentirmaii]PHM42751.1 sensor protein PilS [Xenorhabdus szentirmaii]